MSSLLGVALAASLVACGGGGSSQGPTTPSTPAPPPPAPMVVSQATGLAIESNTLGRLLFDTSRSGTLDATVDWTFPENDVDVAIVGGDCAFEQFLGGQCNIVAASASVTAKPERISGSASAGTYTLFIENVGPGNETLSYQVVLTPSASASVSGSSRSGGDQQWKGGAKTFVELR